jgi:hypothetical protein
MRDKILFAAAAAAFTAAAFVALAQAPAGPPPGARAGGPPAGPPQPMTFFVTGAPKGDGANYGGLAGADAYCQQLGAAAGRGGVKWVAYLSTQGANAVNARDRIGAGPWYNQKGQLIGDSSTLHGDTIEKARLGAPIGKRFALSEKGDFIPGNGDTPNVHDILTGSTPDGRAFAGPAGEDKTCSNWTSNKDGAGSAQVGHHDRQGGGNASWNSAHGSRGCSQANLVATGGNGLLYCFVPTTP